MEIEWTEHALLQIRKRRIAEGDIARVLEHLTEAYIGVSINGAWVYHRKIRRRSLYVLVQPFSNPVRVITVLLYRPQLESFYEN